MPPKSFQKKIIQSKEDITCSNKKILINFFSEDELNFMLNQNTQNIEPEEKYKIIINNFIDIYSIKKKSKDFNKNYINYVNKNIFKTDLFIDMENLENDEILFLTSKAQSINGIPCKVCKSTNTFIADRQTRSGDEGSDVFIICNDCKSERKYV